VDKNPSASSRVARRIDLSESDAAKRLAQTKYHFTRDSGRPWRPSALRNGSGHGSGGTPS